MAYQVPTNIQSNPSGGAYNPQLSSAVKSIQGGTQNYSEAMGQGFGIINQGAAGALDNLQQGRGYLEQSAQQAGGAYGQARGAGIDALMAGNQQGVNAYDQAGDYLSQGTSQAAGQYNPYATTGGQAFQDFAASANPANNRYAQVRAGMQPEIDQRVSDTTDYLASVGSSRSGAGAGIVDRNVTDMIMQREADLANRSMQAGQTGFNAAGNMANVYQQGGQGQANIQGMLANLYQGQGQNIAGIEQGYGADMAGVYGNLGQQQYGAQTDMANLNLGQSTNMLDLLSNIEGTTLEAIMARKAQKRAAGADNKAMTGSIVGGALGAGGMALGGA